MILVGGLMGSGKSTVSRMLGRELGLQLFSSDRVRKELYRVEHGSGPKDPFGSGIYSREADRATYGELLARGVKLLRNGDSVIIDATFCRESDRRLFRKAASDAGVSFVLAMTDCPDEEIRRRLALREGASGVVSDGRLDIYGPHRASFEYPDADSEKFTSVPTGDDIWTGVEAVINALGVNG
jgi:predicted kinase